MPSGMYVRTPEMLHKAKEHLALGRTKEAREKARNSLIQVAKNPEWRAKVSQATTAAMHRPDVRIKHLSGLAKAMEEGTNFKGGNGQTPVAKVMELAEKLEPLGFIREYPVRTAGHNTGTNPPRSYKVDFGHPIRKVAVEVDGPCHLPIAKRLLDEKKTMVLNALGWTVARVKHN